MKVVILEVIDKITVSPNIFSVDIEEEDEDFPDLKEYMEYIKEEFRASCFCI